MPDIDTQLERLAIELESDTSDEAQAMFDAERERLNHWQIKESRWQKNTDTAKAK